jgi:hypothetical protein
MHTLYLSSSKLTPELRDRLLFSLSKTKFEDVFLMLGSFIVINHNDIDVTVLDELLRNENVKRFFQQNQSTIGDYLKTKLDLTE